MRKLSCAVALLLTLGSAQAEQLLPTKKGTTWQYDVTEETGGLTNPEMPSHSRVTWRFSGTEKFAGKELLKLETWIGNVLSRTELLSVDENGILCFVRSGKDGRRVAFVTPQIIVPAHLTTGLSWNCAEEIAGVRIQQHYTVADTENVSVPAGYFETVRLHSEPAAPFLIVVDRWFVAGIGFVKETTTIRSPTADLLQRRTLELARPPGVNLSEKESAKKLFVGVSSQPVGIFENEFSQTTQNIYSRWQGHGLRKNSKVRAVWITEDVGDIAPSNYKIDDAVTTVSAPDAHGMFTLSRPDDGWAPGNYRVEFYLDETLVETVKLKIK
jgi:hypothetical protein